MFFSKLFFKGSLVFQKKTKVKNTITNNITNIIFLVDKKGFTFL
jgi:hypothetical protein